MVQVKKKRVTVETCAFCDEWGFLIECTICGRKACGMPYNRHISSFMSYWGIIGDEKSNNWNYEQNATNVWVCKECQQKPFIEIWRLVQKLGSIAK